jgi:hypothetical protein
MENYFKNKIPKENDGYNICKYCNERRLGSEFETAFMCSSCFKKKKSEQDRQYREANKEEKSLKDKEYQKNNKDKIAKNKRAYYLKNKNQFLARGIISNRKARLDPCRRIRDCISASISKCIKKNRKSLTKYVPYTMQELKEHLEKQFEPWMNWNNHGVYNLDTWKDDNQSTWTWNIDHIKPHSTFHYTSMEDQEFKDCWALNNLRPYSAKQNIIDGDRQ